MTNPVSNLADANLQPGDKFDKYEIVSALGVGGMSRVWKAVDRLLDKPIAIKQLAVDFRNASNQEALRERFRKEAELHKKISGSHKHLVRVIDLLEDPRGLFLLMEYVEGQSLESYLAKHPQPVDPKVALLILGSIAQALAVLHEGGVVHRDLKPANILLPKSGGLKVCDFGLSAFVDEQVSPELGTVRYMAPECFGEAPADPRNDLYSLGMIAYQMLAGEEKFNEAFKTVVRDQRNQALRWMKWHTNARATVEPLHQLVPAIPPALSELVARLMNKELSGRIATANELLAAIRRHFQVPGSESAPATGPATSSTAATAPKPEVSAEPTVALPTRSRKPLYISLVVAAVILVGLGAWGVSSMNSAKEVRLAREAAQQEYSAALAQFKEGNYGEALPMFEKIAKDWSSDQRLSSFSKAHARMAEAETLYAQGEFSQAEAKFQEAEDIGRVEETYAGLDRDHLQKRLREVRTRQSITNIVNEIEGLIREEKFADARERLQRTLRVSAQTLLPEESAKLQELGTRIEGQERQSQIDGVLERARELAAAGQREQALAFLDASLKRFPNRDLQQLSTLFRKEMDMDKAMADLAAAETAGKWPEAAAAARKALQLKRDDAELRQRLSHVLSRAAYERGRKHEQDGDLSAARAAYLEATGLAENKPASDALARITTAGQQESLLKAAEDALAQSNWEAAIRHFEKALQITPNNEAAGKLAKARLNLKADQARSLIDDGNLPLARTLLMEVLRADEAHPIAAAQVDRLAKLQDYQTALQRGDALRKESRFGDAVREYRRARDIKDTPEVKERLDDVEYESWLAKARREITVKNWQAAQSALTAARSIRSTEEVDKLLGDVSEAMKE